MLLIYKTCFFTATHSNVIYDNFGNQHSSEAAILVAADYEWCCALLECKPEMKRTPQFKSLDMSSFKHNWLAVWLSGNE